MLKAALLTILSAASLLVLAGCESHQAKVDRLQKEYDDLEAQFSKDCSADVPEGAANPELRSARTRRPEDERRLGLDFRRNAPAK